MQRSRRALLHRRALQKAAICGRNRWYTVSLSLVFLLWGLVFLASLWTSRSYGYAVGSREALGGILTWEEAGVTRIDEKDNENDSSEETDSKVSHESSCNFGADADISSNLQVNGEGNSDFIPFVDHSERVSSKSDQVAHVVLPSLDEFKSKVYNSRSKSVSDQVGGVKHRVEPGGAEYNYASLSKGAKVLAYNKEAKGASNILGKDQDKYFLNPCSAEEKFVVVELSEETLVDTIAIANFEHYSSTLKDFQLLGSSVYPTDEWIKLGNFTAANVKHAQRFPLQEPKWVRYLKLNQLSHYGSGFYCTLSVLEVYGVDAVERMLEDLITTQDSLFLSKDLSSEQKLSSSQPEPTKADDVHLNPDDELETNPTVESSNAQHEVKKSKLLDHPVEEKDIRHLQAGMMPGDSVLKILMQKVRSLDVNLFVLEHFLDDLNSKYGNIYKQFDNKIEDKALILENIRTDIKNFADSMEIIAKDVDDLVSWKSLVSIKLDNLIQDNAVLRSEVQKLQDIQIQMENKGIIVFIVSLIFGFVAFVRVFIDILVIACGSNESGKFCWTCSSWIFLLLSCTTVIFFLSL